jgi:prepilin-type processing-associated H-X9-DG protein/prepilin-type N-terminal cleavage/methylation domain-containing protein
MRVRSAFTLIELLTVIVVIGMLVGMLLPAINWARGSAQRAFCQSNLRQISLAMEEYLNIQGTNGKYPDAAVLPSVTPNRPSIPDVISPWLEDNLFVFHCPSDDIYLDAEGLSYEYRAFRFAGKTREQAMRSLFGVVNRSRSEVWMMYDYEAFHGSPNQPGARNVLFADGHVEPF